jgi:hypothetical protein
MRQQAIPVRVQGKPGTWSLTRGGRPYLVQGAGGDASLELLRQCGGNSTRGWGADNARRDLDKAQAAGVTLTVGIWLGHKGHGFRYNDAKMVGEQQAKAEQVVAQHKNHPALLAWGLGNEMEGDGEDPMVWQAIEHLAARVKALDPDHPTMTVIAELGRDGIKPKQIQKLCPSIDILGVNSYGGLATLDTRLKAAGWNKPYIVTEWGPLGPWEVGKTDWNASLEQTSTEKAALYARNYERAIKGAKGRCVGSYAFLWGTKQEVTPTWFGVFEPETGDSLEAVEVLTRMWGGQPLPGGAAPKILRLESKAVQARVRPGESFTVRCVGPQMVGGQTYRFAVRSDEPGKWSFEPGQKTPKPIPNCTPPPGSNNEITFTAPTQPGPYRLYVIVQNKKGKAATANFPFLVV